MGANFQRRILAVLSGLVLYNLLGNGATSSSKPLKMSLRSLQNVN